MGENENPGALAGATGAGPWTFRGVVARNSAHGGVYARHAIAARDALKAAAPALAVVPASVGRALVDAALRAVDDARAAAGVEPLGYGDHPTRAELRASWLALAPLAGRARR